MMRHRHRATALACALVLTACSAADDGADVRTLNDTESASDDATSPTTGSASGLAPGSATSAPLASDAADPAAVVVEAVNGDGPYTYASDVASHRLVTRDVCAVKTALGATPADFTTAGQAYRSGGNSPNGDVFRTLGGFATATDRLHELDDHYDDAQPLDAFVSAALDGVGTFDGETSAVRAQAVEKGVQNQILVAWMIHELNSALAKADDGNFDAAEGAPHNWDEAWAYYHGAEPDCSPYATAESRAENFGTLTEGETAQANEAIVGAMNAGRDALLDGDADAARAAAVEVRRQLVITYSQAAIRYASLAVDDMAGRDDETARVHQAEGWAFFRVIEPTIAAAGGDVTTVLAILDLVNQPAENGSGDNVRTALQPAWDALGITAADIGVLS